MLASVAFSLAVRLPRSKTNESQNSITIADSSYLDDTGVISSTLVSISTDLSSRPLTTLDKSLITASTSLFALAISPLSGLLATRLGRRPVLLISDIFFLLGALLQCISNTVLVMVIGRSVVGFAVGAASFVTPLYIAELAPKQFRGRLVTLNVLFVTLGQVIAYAIGWAFADWGGQGGWRWMVGLGGLPAVLQACLLFSMPESPRWLILTGREAEARNVLLKVFGQGYGATVDSVLKDIQIEVREEELAKRGRMRSTVTKRQISFMGDTWAELLRVPGHRRALAIACLLQGLQQLCGFSNYHHTWILRLMLTNISRLSNVFFCNAVQSPTIFEPNHDFTFSSDDKHALHGYFVASD